jgi:hypothetical protein
VIKREGDKKALEGNWSEGSERQRAIKKSRHKLIGGLSTPQSLVSFGVGAKLPGR